MKCWFDTLNQALDSCGLIGYWPLGTNIEYGQTKRVHVGGYLISIYRSSNGMYERPVYYKTGVKNAD